MNKLVLYKFIVVSLSLLLIGCGSDKSWNNDGNSNTVPSNESNTNETQDERNGGINENDKSETSNSKVPSEFVLIEGGSFIMGSPETEAWRGDDEMEHTVNVSDFYMSMHEVTQQEYQSFMKDNPSVFSGDNNPVENVSWIEAIRYCNERSLDENLTLAYSIEENQVIWNRDANGYRLPTEAEWEYACRAGSNTPFNTENSISADEANYFGHYPYMIEENYFAQGKLETQPGVYREKTVEVGSFEPNAWGLYDMHGNASEWCWDFYGEYEIDETEDPSGPETGSLRINRGGAWNDFAKHLRSAYRSSTPQENSSSVGMRLVRNAVATNEGIINTTSNMSSSEDDKDNKKILIVYFSWSGNTRCIAEQIQQMTGADIFEIELVNPYSRDYNTVLEQAQHDQAVQARPELKTQVENMASYSTILLGYPNWWASIPMPVASFLEEYDFSEKTIAPFSSYGGGRMGQSITAISKIVPQANISGGLDILYSGGSDRSEKIIEWLKSNGVPLLE